MRHTEAVAQSPYSWAFRAGYRGTSERRTFVNASDTQVLQIGDHFRKAKNCQKPVKFTDWQPVEGNPELAASLNEAAEPVKVNTAQWGQAAVKGFHKWAFRRNAKNQFMYMNLDGTRATSKKEFEGAKVLPARGGWNPSKFTDWRPVGDHAAAMMLDQALGRASKAKNDLYEKVTLEPMTNGRGLQKLMSQYTKYMDELGQSVDTLKETMLDNPNLREHIASIRDLSESLLALL